MVFYFLISIVFMAEVIISLTVIISLIKADKKIVEYNELVEKTKPSIKSIMELSRKISEQLTELVPMFADKIKLMIQDLIMGQVKSVLGGLTFWLVKKEVEKHAG